MAGLRLEINKAAVEPADGDRKTFSVPFTVYDPTRLEVYAGRPYVLYAGPIALPGERQWSYANNQVTLGDATAPPAGQTPTFAGLTLDAPPLPYDLIFNAELLGVKDGSNVVFTLPQKALAGADSVALFAGDPGSLLERADPGPPGFTQYVVAADLVTITLGLGPLPTDQLRATFKVASTATEASTQIPGAHAAEYRAIRQRVKAKINRYGRPLIISQRTGNPVYDTESGTVAENLTDRAFRGVVTNINHRMLSAVNTAGQILEATDRVVLCLLDEPPLMSDEVEIDGVGHRIVMVQRVNPGGVNLLDKLVVRA